MSHLAPTLLAFFTPKSGGSPNADQINSLYKITLVIALVIFVAVEGALGYTLWQLPRAQGRRAAPDPRQHAPGDRLDARRRRDPVGLAVVTFTKLASIQDPSNSGPNGDQVIAESGAESGLLYASAERKLPPNGKSLNITVIGRQFIWQYVYPGANERDGLGAPYSYEEMVVPTETTVTLDIVSQDVVHSWWIPELGGKFQAVPGYHNYTWFKIPKPGIYRGQCAALCGRGHARMIATVKAVPPAQFDAWLAYQKQELKEANAEAAVERAKLNSQTGPGRVENP